MHFPFLSIFTGLNFAQIMLCVLLFMWVFYGEYVRIMAIYRAYLKRLLKWYHYVLLGPWVIAGALMDVLCNLILGTIAFRELPRQWLLTTRMMQILNDPNADVNRRALASDICHMLLDPFDPSGNHCADNASQPLST